MPTTLKNISERMLPDFTVYCSRPGCDRRKEFNVWLLIERYGPAADPYALPFKCSCGYHKFQIILQTQPKNAQ